MGGAGLHKAHASEGEEPLALRAKARTNLHREHWSSQQLESGDQQGWWRCENLERKWGWRIKRAKRDSWEWWPRAQRAVAQEYSVCVFTAKVQPELETAASFHCAFLLGKCYPKINYSGSLCSEGGWAENCVQNCNVKVGLELTILLLQPPECWAARRCHHAQLGCFIFNMHI